ncbi:amino acid deaminase [Pseudoalteromonas sp. KS88]|uniref:amino acid deaminase n=1 Tax=Pseudoalteromonas sp. KS88 TaxID=2109918 RepID=UPI00108189CA|nr:amino acid deaminase [Pseudoalteromonas sp. KS88]TGE84918.1 amino acid deaminase [Pseudoalteromonas sp. KS88]
MSELSKGSGCIKQLQQTGWDIFKEQVSLPVAVIKQDNIKKNAKWMADFTAKHNMLLAPHGKTTMSTELFKIQLDAGAWGITLATVAQVINAFEAGITRVIMANQLVGKFHFEQIAKWLESSKVEFYCFADSIENLTDIGEFFAERNLSVNVLLEVGIKGGRCGLRSAKDISSLVATCEQYTSLELMGIAFYEGVIGGENAAQQVKVFVDEVNTLAKRLQVENRYNTDKPIITGAGSAWYDIVAKTLYDNSCSDNFNIILRPGCYLIHDTGIYQKAQQAIMARSQVACDIPGDLENSLSIWAYVLSLPEPGLAIIGMGKRDVAFDAGLPTAELIYSVKTNQLRAVNSAFKVEKIMDQHCMLRYSDDQPLRVGDMMSFSTSHPCLTFDKWRQIGIVEDEWVITKTISTQF